MYSNFKVGDAVVRRWNNRVYYICHDVDSDKQEFMIDQVKDQKFRKCKTCEIFSNLRLADETEVKRGYADEF